MTNKTANVVVRIEPDIKKRAEAVLGNIGLSMSDAVNLFCRQIIFQNGIPFDLKSEFPPELDASSWTEDEVTEKVMHGVDDYKHGKVTPAEDVFNELEKDLPSGV